MKKSNKLKILLLIAVLLSTTIGGAYCLYRYYQKPNKIVLISKSIQSEYIFWETIKMGAELAAREENIEFEYTGPLEEKDVDVQMQILKEKIDEDVDIILLAATDSEKLEGLVEEAKNKGITLVMIDSTVGEETYTVATNNIEAAKNLTQDLVSRVGGEGEIIMLNFIQGASTAKQRQEGYNLEIEMHPKITKLPTRYTDGTTEDSYIKTKEIIQKYPDIKGIIGGNQYTTEGVCLAVEELGLKGKIKVVGFDSSDIIITALEKGIIDSIIVQKPFNMGYIGVKMAMKLFNRDIKAIYQDTGYKLITKDILYLTENQKLLYPIIE